MKPSNKRQRASSFIGTIAIKLRKEGYRGQNVVVTHNSNRQVTLSQVFFK